MALGYFEKYEIGADFETKACTITATDIVEKNNRCSYG